jgi:hypothetical protein
MKSRATSAGRSETGACETKILAFRARLLKPISKTMCWEDLPTLPNDEGKDAPLEFGEVMRCATSHL